MIILVDVDGVIAQFYQSMLSHVKAIAAVRYADDPKLSKSLDYCDITTYWCYDQMPIEHEEIAYEVTNTEDFWRNLPEIPGAVEAVNELAKKHTILFVTSPLPSCPAWADIRYGWLKERFPWLDRKQFIPTAGKEYIDGDILIEDSQKNIDDWTFRRTARNGHKSYRSYLFYAPYNRFARIQWGWKGILQSLSTL